MGEKIKLSRNLRTSKSLDWLTRGGETRCYPKYWTLIFNANVIVCFLHDARSEVVWLCFSDLTIITTALNFQPNTIGCMEYQILRHYKKKKSSLCFGVCAIMIVLSYSPLQWALSWPPLWLRVYPCGHPWDCSSWTNISSSTLQCECISDICSQVHTGLFFSGALDEQSVHIWTFGAAKKKKRRNIRDWSRPFARNS